jgi:hypothetical protein
MSAKSETEAGEVRITVDGAEFYSFVRAMKRSYRASELGEVAIQARAVGGTTGYSDWSDPVSHMAL